MIQKSNKGEISLFVIIIVLILIVIISLVAFYALTGNFKVPDLIKKENTENVAETSDLTLDQIKEIMWDLEDDKELDAYLQSKIDSKEDFIQDFTLTWTDRVANDAIAFSGSDFDCANLISNYAKAKFTDGLPNPGLGKSYTIQVLIDLSRGTKNIQIKVNE